MSTFQFRLGPGHLGRKAARAAKEHGAELHNYTDPQCQCGHGCRAHTCPRARRHWFSAPSLGEPFDSRTAREVLAALAAVERAQ